MNRSIIPDLSDYSDPVRFTVAGLVSSRVRIVKLADVPTDLFERIRAEVMGLMNRHEGQVVGGDHPTYAFVRKQDPNWVPLEGGVIQYSLYNSQNKITYNNDDHHWSSVNRKFLDELQAIPEFFRKYFGDSELQNFRMQAIKSGGSLGQHREKIVGIPNRESHYKVRFHLPIITNSSVRFLMEGEEFQMQAGSIYLFNQGSMHGVSNDGDLRVHLIWDCYLNEPLIENFLYPKCRPFC